jgi:ElaB/YqjD/DUF883 family membrane-anchored ribosome-binding protein
MPDEQEAIRQDMEETRSSLTDKISILEERVVETVHDASEGVKDTIEKVKDAVEESVCKVKETFGDTVDTVKETFSIRTQVERRPWLAMAGAVGIGFLAGHWLSQPERTNVNQPLPRPKRYGNGAHRDPAASFSAPRPAAEAGIVDHLSKTFESELTQIKGLAIGTLGGIVRDLVTDIVPDMLRPSVTEVLNGVTTKLGGQAIPERILAQPHRDEGARAEEDKPYRHPRQSTSMQY